MRSSTRPFMFHRVYHCAGIVDDIVNDSGFFIELSWNESEIVEKLYKCSKVSLLGHFIFRALAVADSEDFSLHFDLYEDDPDLVAEGLESSFAAYGIEFISFKNFLENFPDGWEDSPNVREGPFYKWIEAHDDQLELLWTISTDEVFHLLFSNRLFLLRFNKSLAEFLKSGKVNIPPMYLDSKGMIKRQAHFPIWAKRAVFYRDQGKCVFCGKDLSGLLSTDQRLHYDHIVPLNLWGTNDPCNLQLLCEACNLKKSGTSARTGIQYTTWWDY